MVAPSSYVLKSRANIQHHTPAKLSLHSLYFYNAHLAAYVDAHLMAPVFPRQSHHFPSPPRPPKEEPATPAPVTKHFSARVFFELFAGTFGIFVVGVLFWKLGRCLRRFTRGKVLREGKTTGMRYARTWYGWIPLQRHEAAKNLFQKCWVKICEWTAWKSTRADYSWVWWDPGQRAYEEHRRKKAQLRWLPEFLRSMSFTTADAMWNYDIQGQCANTPKEHQPAAVTKAPRDIRIIHQISILPESSENTNQWEVQVSKTRHQLGYSTTPLINRGLPCKGATYRSFPRTHDASIDKCHLPSRKDKMFLSLDQPIGKHRGRIPFLDGDGNDPVSQQIVPPLHQSLANTYRSRKLEQEYTTRKYRVQTAKTQLNASNPSKHNQSGFREPPGTPTTDTLGSHASENSQLFGSLGKRRGKKGRLSSDRSTKGMRSFKQLHFTERTVTKKSMDKDSRLLVFPHGELLPSSSRDMLSHRRFTSSPFDSICGNISPPGEPTLFRTRAAKGKWPEEGDPEGDPRFGSLNQKPIPPQDLSEWEIRWVDNVDRKLEWHVNQLSPGRRPFHFPLLANHWLNKRTWIIFDPASRVPTHNQRQWGDPRFNVPYPAPCWGAKPKYQAVGHKLAHTPRIDSWRVAVNRQRRASGIRNLIRTVELFDDSIDDPPDGMVDPACWLLRKPPQGFLASSKRDSTYYEGGRGWQEKFRDWQRVRHGYRIRKMIYEGRANRTRVKELATSISRPCRSAASKAIEIIKR